MKSESECECLQAEQSLIIKCTYCLKMDRAKHGKLFLDKSIILAWIWKEMERQASQNFGEKNKSIQ